MEEKSILFENIVSVACDNESVITGYNNSFHTH